jgi:hypothetical protein
VYTIEQRAHTQMKWSDSRVRDWKLIEAGWIPSAVSYIDSSVASSETSCLRHQRLGID